MLNFMLQGTYQDSEQYTWTFYGDDEDDDVFYIVPRPQFVSDAHGEPQISLVQYKTDSPLTNHAGYCQATVELAVPQPIIDIIQQKVPSVFPKAKQPRYQALSTNPGAMAYFDFSDGTGTTTFAASASSYGGNVATFVLHLAPVPMQSLIATLSTSGVSYPVTYRISVPASLQAFSAVLTFDSQIAFQYQITGPRYNSWGEQTSPGFVTKTLQESGASNVKLTWGISHPSQQQQQAVAEWANNTLATLVEAEVKQAISIENQSSWESFQINSVGSFKNTFSENQVIDWIIMPQVTLPALGKNIGKFLDTVDRRRQVMTVSTQLPFLGQGGSPGVSGFTPAKIKSVTVTVKYPTLDEKDATFTFQQGGSHTFACDYSELQGPKWTLEYAVDFAGGTPFTATVTDIDTASYSIQPAQVGFLAVKFDATDAYAANPLLTLESIDVKLAFMATEPTAQPFTQTHELTKAKPVTIFHSPLAYPINEPYNFTVTYNYLNQPAYSAPTVRGQTGFYQKIGPAAGVNETGIWLVFKQSISDPILSAEVKLWYDALLKIPGMSNQPTAQAPQSFTLTPQPLALFDVAYETFLGYPLGHAPLIYSASLTTVAGQVEINEQPVENDAPAILVSPTQRYFTVTISPAAIDWSAVAFNRVVVEIALTAIGSGGTSTQLNVQRSFTWHKGETDPSYVTYAYDIKDPDGPAPTLTYTWSAQYTVPPNTKRTKPVTASDVVLAIPGLPPG
jgi:hypothetical protein